MRRVELIDRQVVGEEHLMCIGSDLSYFVAQGYAWGDGRLFTKNRCWDSYIYTGFVLCRGVNSHL
ncbi:hypothetical protein DZJ_20870 [Dickeya ananatis]